MRRPSGVLSTGLRLDGGFGSAGTAALWASADDFFPEGNHLSLAATGAGTFGPRTTAAPPDSRGRLSLRGSWCQERNSEAHRGIENWRAERVHHGV